jgi:hypothetical protein
MAFRNSVEERVNGKAGRAIEPQWKNLKATIIKSEETHIGYRQGEGHRCHG